MGVAALVAARSNYSLGRRVDSNLDAAVAVDIEVELTEAQGRVAEKQLAAHEAAASAEWAASPARTSVVLRRSCYSRPM
jgi:hypothetical protein